MLEGWEVGMVPITTGTERMRPSREGSLLNRKLGLGLSSYSVPSDDGQMYEAIFNLTHLATGLRIIMITGNVGDVIRMVAEIGQLTDWTKEQPDDVAAVASKVWRIVGDHAWHDHSTPEVVGHA